MKRIAATWALSALLLAAGSARADTVTIEAGNDLTNVFGNVIGPLQSQASFAFSELFLGALSIANVPVSGVLPASLKETADTIDMEAPVRRITGEVDVSTGHVEVRHIATQGGMTFTVVRSGSSRPRPGSVTLTDLTVDLANNAIYADVVGANGVGSWQDLHFWNFESMSGSSSLQWASCSLAQYPNCPSSYVDGLQLSGLAITQQGFDLFTQALAFTAFGKSSMSGIEDYGTLTISAVPESSTLALMALGLLGLALQARRKRLTHPAHHP